MKEMKIIEKNILFKDLTFGDMVIIEDADSGLKSAPDVLTVLYPGILIITLIDENGGTHHVNEVWDKLDLVGHSDKTFNELKENQLTYEYNQVLASIKDLQKHADFLESERKRYEVLAYIERHGKE